uniref:Uncharacterized protein n=1 Tax=Acrobeloides nanus TaxID=290746 RepID=A0A914CMD8_9BILA
MKVSKNSGIIASSLLTRFAQSKICCPHHGGETGVAMTGTDVSGDTEYAFQVSGNTLRFGIGVTSEVGYDVKALKSKRPVIFTDTNVKKTRAFT